MMQGSIRKPIRLMKRTTFKNILPKIKDKK